MKITIGPDEPRWVHFDGAVDIINSHHWELSMRERDGRFELLNGRGVVAEFDSMSELETFTAGMALVLDVLPRRVRPKKHL